jgi:quinol monooxygenase YgiN
LYLNGDRIMTKAYTVIAFLEAKPGKESELKQRLEDVVEPSRAENTCLEYRLHQDLNNPAQFVIYENWKSKEAHQEQFQKSYITALIKKLEELLAKPYQAIFAHEV